MGLVEVTPPAVEPITFDDAKGWLKIDADDELNDINSVWIPKARKDVEIETQRAFVNTIFDLTLDEFPCSGEIRPPRSPLVSVTSISYIDVNGNSQTWNSSNYTVDVSREPGRIVPVFNVVWPSVRAVINAVTVRFTAGYGTTAAAVPAEAKAAILSVLAHDYRHRDNDEPWPMELKALLFRMGVHTP